MKTLPNKLLWILAACMLGTAPVRAEDIDLYTGIGGTTPPPNILIILDNPASFSNQVDPGDEAKFACTYADDPTAIPSMGKSTAGIEQCAIYNVVHNLPADSVKLGFMGVNATQFTRYDCTAGGVGGCLLQPVTLLTAERKVALKAWIKSWENALGTPNSIKATGGATASMMQEAWAYFSGNRGLSGRNYADIQPSAGCQRNYVIFIGDAYRGGKPGETGSAGPWVALGYAGATDAMQQSITISYPAGSACYENKSYTMDNHRVDGTALWADEWARFMRNTDIYGSLEDSQSISTYTIGVLGPRCWPHWPALLTSMAGVGGGKYYPTMSYTELYRALMEILNEVQAVNSVFASASLPVSVNAQGTYENQVFMGMFRPDPNGLRRWLGNLKQFQFGVTGSTTLDAKLFLADATGKSAISGAGTGFISPNSISFWTAKDTSKLPDITPPGGYWVNNPQGTGLSYDYEDGEIVEKGGVSQQIRLANLTTNYASTPTAPRKLYTCTGTCLTSSGTSIAATPFATTNTALTASVLGIDSAIYTVPVSSVHRDASSRITTYVLGATPSPPIIYPNSIVAYGSTNGQYDGALGGPGPWLSGTTEVKVMTMSVYPRTPVTPNIASSGASTTYSVTGTTGGVAVRVLSRSGVGRVTVTATVSDIGLGSGTALAVNDRVSISGSNGYDAASATVTGVTGASGSALPTFTYELQETPAVTGGDAGAGDNFYIGASCDSLGSNANCDRIAASPGGLIRGLSESGEQWLLINLRNGLKRNVVGQVGSGNRARLQRVTPSAYDNSTASLGYPLMAIGADCRVTYIDSAGVTRTVIGTANSADKFYSVCVQLPSNFATSPPATGGIPTTGSVTARRVSNVAPNRIMYLSRNDGTCSDSAANFGDSTAEATAWTESAHGFTAGTVVSIASSNPVTGEEGYAGAFAVTATGSGTPPDSTTAFPYFKYRITITPRCLDTNPGMHITYQNNSDWWNTRPISPTDLINWVRGADNAGDERGPGSGVTVRPSVHGDVLHSRPVVINYGGTTGIVVFYGANDGVYRAINGNKTRSIGTTSPGGELWGFIPTEFFTNFTRLYLNSPALHLYPTPTTIDPKPKEKDYFFDGIAGVYQKLNGTTTEAAYLFLSARRGGRLIYALDVTDPTNPKFLWKRSCPNPTKNDSCDAGFSELGQTWSQPKVALVKGWADTDGNPKPVLIFGAGYYGGYIKESDTYYGEDAQPPTANNLMGRGLFILDAATGCIVWQASSNPATSGLCTGGATSSQASMTYAVPADVTLVNRDFDSFIDRLYAADVGGNVWRIDLEPTAGHAPTNWQVTRLASLGGPSADKRKFLYPPDVVATKSVDIVLVSSGDREHPLYAHTNTYSVVNKFYGLYDTKTGKDASGWTTIVDDTASNVATAPASFVATSAGTVSAKAYETKSGFYFAFPNAGEKGVNAPTTVGGLTYFATNQPPVPSNTSCKTTLGTARGYQVNFVTGETRSTTFDGGGLPPSPIAGLVNVLINGSPALQPFCIGCGGPAMSTLPGQTPYAQSCTGPDCNSAIGALKPPVPISNVRRRTYWFLDRHDN